MIVGTAEQMRGVMITFGGEETPRPGVKHCLESAGTRLVRRLEAQQGDVSIGQVGDNFAVQEGDDPRRPPRDKSVGLPERKYLIMVGEHVYARRWASAPATRKSVLPTVPPLGPGSTYGLSKSPRMNFSRRSRRTETSMRSSAIRPCSTSWTTSSDVPLRRTDRIRHSRSSLPRQLI